MLTVIIALSAVLGATTTALVEFCKRAAASGNALFVKIVGGWKTIVLAIVVGGIVGAAYKAMLVLNIAALLLTAEKVTALAAFAGVTWLGFIAAGVWSGAIISGIIGLISSWLNPKK